MGISQKETGQTTWTTCTGTPFTSEKTYRGTARDEPSYTNIERCITWRGGFPIKKHIGDQDTESHEEKH